MEETLQTAQNWLLTYGMNLIGAIILLIIGKWAAGIFSKFLKNLMIKRKVDPTLVTFFSNCIYYVLLIIVVIAVLDLVGIRTASFVAIIGAAGLAIGFALQGSLSNFASGVMLIIFRPFKVDDFVEAGGATGIVEEISIFTTQMRTPDNKTVIIPNSNITGSNITNYSSKDTRRVDLVFGVGYGDDLDKARRVVEEVLRAEERILADPEPTIGVSELADSSVNFVVRPWVNSDDYWPVYFSLTENMKKRFDAEGISIPFPQRDVHLFKPEA